MAATNCRVCYLTANAVMKFIVLPDTDKQLTDPAFSPSDSVCVNWPMTSYMAATKMLDVMKGTVAAVTTANPTVGALLAAIILALGG